MSAKIIVAGAGHGGISVAAILAQNGYDVTVYEKEKEGTLGYDWTDIFAPGALKTAGIGMPDEDKYEYKENMTFYSPNMKKGLRQDVASDQLEIKMERKDIYSHLINHAVQCGVEFVYDCLIECPLMAGNRVVGIRTSQGDFYGDLIIDAAGIDSPVRTRLPAVCGIEKIPGDFSQFNVYRAFFNRGTKEEVEDKYKVCLLPCGNTGVGWIAAEEEYSDLLIGLFEPLTNEKVDEIANRFRIQNPVLGTELKRGGQFVKIPVRQPLAIMVCDGYAAIGDSAFMTVPVIGSGIANSLRASRMLADTIMADKYNCFCADTLWDYQVKYYKNLGSGLAQLACVKLMLAELKPEELDYMFDNGILTGKDLTIGADSTSLVSFINFSPAEIIEKAKNVCKDPVLLKKILLTGKRIASVVAVTTTMPRHWNRQNVFRWAKQYKMCFQIK
ncbi:MAG: NAD(P)/FAD-dependent oxidoreductase [Clostridia bacterium]|nr:NAD(P)/FAD-dependent oxidoreductase [Clostridia bacterium]